MIEKCENTCKKSFFGRWGKYLSAIGILIFPKCMACFFAAGAAITVCGLPDQGSGDLSSGIMIGLIAMVTMVQFYINRQGLLYTAAGIVFIAIFKVYELSLIWYYLGATIMATGLLQNHIKRALKF